MNEETPREKRFEELDMEKSTRLLSLGLTESGRPVDELADRLERTDGEAWFARLLQEAAAPSLPRVAEALRCGGVTLDELTELKNECKLLLKEAKDQETRLSGVAGYFLAIAGGLVHHDRLISSHNRGNLVSVFLDLAAVSPEPWQSLWTKAAWECGEKSSDD